MKQQIPTIEQLFKIIGDNITLRILELATNGFRAHGGGLAKQLKISKKQYNTRLAKLRQSGLLVKNEGVYSLSPSGEVVWKCIIRVARDLLKNYWRLKAINMIAKLPTNERRKIIDDLLTDTVIKEYLD